MEVAIVTFGGRVTRLIEFVTATKFEPPTLQPIGGTPMGEAINTALDMIEERKASYREHGIAYYRPWAFLITDGEPNDHWKPVVSRVQDGREAEVVLLLRRGRRRGQHAGARGDLRSQAALVARHEVPRAVQLAVEFAAGGVAFVARRRSAARGSDHRPARLGSRLRCQACGDTLPKACKGPVTHRRRHSLPGLLTACACSAKTRPQTLVACVADGAGSAKFSDIGSTIACNTIVENAASYFERDGGFDNFEREDALRWCDEVRTRIRDAAGERDCDARELATTLCVAIVAAPNSSTFFKSATAAIILRNHGVYGVVFWPQSGEYANSTNFSRPTIIESSWSS